MKTALRVPPDLHRALHEAATEAERTFNAEILHRLRSTFKGKRKTSTTPEGQQS
ncbi:toxin-antitoxin system HicB family antitoxin [Variovorax paradoxus]|nr:toxin-antitoxin system HicB family antitoxin [Variovorax paradoxus]